MRSVIRAVVGALASATVAVALTACSNAGDLSVFNYGPGNVTVDTGDEENSLEADGGVVLLNYGCTPGDVTIKFETGTEIVLPGPVCPEQEIVIGNETATLRPVASDARNQM